ncbi:serine phosphatase RsbU (regulator of sigma subunit) [Kineococcus xinjiangensis]|uniref:Serine phosphatase RsbU (Regulator of sigma subunit) n=1 Tax=Kineococcus xinjiangensis TaxID=512762 RepID=A0A2S6IUE1_9ACTN|nr:serine phosphatase RsbU (regulator of sigma subunit) [Kineococcus xinjiangensis]
MRRGTALLLALAWVLVLWACQAAVGGRLVVVPWLALAPLAASLVLTWRGTAAVAAAVVLAVTQLSAATGDLWTGFGGIRVAGGAALSAFAVFSAHVRVRREAHIRAVTEVATVAQAAIQPPVPARVGHVALASRYVSASADALVGGDLFDVVAADGGVRLIVGDARGKGLPAVHVAAAVLSAFRLSAPRVDVPLEEVARHLEAAITPRLAEEDFVTAVLCELHPSGRLDIVRCGHPAPLRLVAGRTPEEVGNHSCPPLGLGVEPVVESTVLRAGERLLLHTDGLVEARDAEGRFFDVLRAASALVPSGGAPAEALDADLEGLLEKVRAHVGGTLTDDVAVLLVEALEG